MIKILFTEMKIFWNWWHFNNNESQIFIFRPVIWLDCTFTDTCFYLIPNSLTNVLNNFVTYNQQKIDLRTAIITLSVGNDKSKTIQDIIFFYQQLLFKLVAIKENSNMALEIFNVESVKRWLNWMIIILKYILIFPF